MSKTETFLIRCQICDAEFAGSSRRANCSAECRREAVRRYGAEYRALGKRLHQELTSQLKQIFENAVAQAAAEVGAVADGQQFGRELALRLIEVLQQNAVGLALMERAAREVSGGLAVAVPEIVAATAMHCPNGLDERQLADWKRAAEIAFASEFERSRPHSNGII
jgi:uncharacterized protein YukE